MAHEALAFTILSILVVVLYRYLNQTDTPKIKGLAEIPGVPIFGNLIQLGENHARVAAKWAKQYGPVFQVRMGNRVCFFFLFFFFSLVNSYLPAQ